MSSGIPFMKRIRLPATYEVFCMLRDVAQKMCWDGQFERAFAHLEYANHVVSVLHVNGAKDYFAETTDILSDMSCVMQKLGRFADAYTCEKRRLQILVGVDSPLECFLNPDNFDLGSDEILVLRDAYSAIASLCMATAGQLQRSDELEPALSSMEAINAYAEKLQGGNNLNLAVSSLKETYAFLQHCSLFSESHVQIRNVRRKIGCVLRRLNRAEEAAQYDDPSKTLPGDSSENRAYTNANKIFFRATPGGEPELYNPHGRLSAANDKSRVEIENLVMKLVGLNEAEQEDSAPAKTNKKPARLTTHGVPATYANFAMLRDLAKKLCHEKEWMQAFHQLEHAAYVLQVINVKHESEALIYSLQAADVLGDMACIMQLRCDYKKAYQYEMVRLGTLTGYELPLFEDFELQDDDKHNLALSDTYSALFTILNLQAGKMQCEGKLSDALEAFESALKMLDRCVLIADNHVQITQTRRNIACVLRALSRGAEAAQYEAPIAILNVKIGAFACTYRDEDKIFFRPTHGGAPELYLPGKEESDASSYENRQEIKALVRNLLQMRVDGEDLSAQQLGSGSKKKAEHAFQCLKSLAAMEFFRKQEDADKSMQKLLEEEEADRKRAAEKASNKNKKRASKTKQARERKHDAERVVEERFQEQQDIAEAVKASKSGLLLPRLCSLSLSALHVVKAPPVSVSTVAVSTVSVPPVSVPPVSAPPVSVPPAPPPVSLSPVSAPPASKETEMSAYLEHFICPISLEVMEDPVITADGSSYERASIEVWFKKTDRDPLTNEIVTSKVLIPNKTLKSAIQATRELQRVLEECGLAKCV